MSKFTIALFGEAEKGEFHAPYFCQTLEQLDDCFGNPPEAVKAYTMLCKR